MIARFEVMTACTLRPSQPGAGVIHDATLGRACPTEEGSAKTRSQGCRAEMEMRVNGEGETGIWGKASGKEREQGKEESERERDKGKGCGGNRERGTYNHSLVCPVSFSLVYASSAVPPWQPPVPADGSAGYGDSAAGYDTGKSAASAVIVPKRGCGWSILWLVVFVVEMIPTNMLLLVVVIVAGFCRDDASIGEIAHRRTAEGWVCNPRSAVPTAH